MNLLKYMIRKHGVKGILMAMVGAVYYNIRQVRSDSNNKLLAAIAKERQVLSEEISAAIAKVQKFMTENPPHKDAIRRMNEATVELAQAATKHNVNPTTDSRIAVEIALKKLEARVEEFNKLDISIEGINKQDISEIVTFLYNTYDNFISSLTPDKIVCVVNILIDYSLFSSFFTVLSIMLSEGVIKKFTFLDKYPRILHFLQLRTIITKKVAKIYLCVHLFFILFGLLGNTYMFFL